MAKLYIGCDYIDFIYANTHYKGVLSKIVLDTKIVVRVDYTCQDNLESGRCEISYYNDPLSDKPTWITQSEQHELATVLKAEIERNPAILQLD